MRKQIIPFLSAFSFCLMVLLIDLIPTWNPRSIAASQDPPTAAEVAAAIEEQKQEAANMARSQLAEQKFRELSAKAQSDGTAPVIVKLRVAFRPEGDLPSAASVQAQRAVIAQTQDSLMKELTGYDPASLKRYEFTPHVAVKVNASGLEELRLSSNVIDIHPDQLQAPSLINSIPASRVDFAWADGFTGVGKTVAILDTGVDRTHFFLSAKVFSQACYSTNNPEEHASSLCPGGVSESTDFDSGRNCTTVSGCEHGTHVAGIAAGKAIGFSGVAKDANLISVQVFSRIDDSTECGGTAPCLRSFTSDLMKALERVYTLRNSLSIASVNLSLGSGRFTSNCDTNPLKSIIDQLRSAGIATVIASGNNGFTDAISEPACISSAISVGATGNIGDVDKVATFSNSASFLNLLAPGVSIVSSVPEDDFAFASGTSMAAPHVAGAWAILQQKNPGASVTELLNLLTVRGFPVHDARNGLTFPRLNLGPLPECVTTNIPFRHWKGEYFSNTELGGAALLIRDDGDSFLNFDIGEGSPNSTCGPGADNFSVRWTRRVALPIGRYRFTVTGDDGVRLWVNGKLVIDKWFVQGAATYTADVFIPGGEPELRLEYFESSGNALARVSWETLVGSECYANVPFSRWKGEFYGNKELAGDPLIVRDFGDSFVNFDVGVGSPGEACGVGVDNFSARWTRNINFPIGRYRFTVTGDDGVRLWVGGKLIIDKWLNQAATTYTAEMFLTSGFYEVRLEYFESGGNALARLSWETLAGSNCFANVPFGNWRGQYYNSTDLTGDPAMVRNDGAGFLNFDIGVGSPSEACGVSADNFSARWSRTVNLQQGHYRFTVTGDDGVRLYVSGRLLIDKWFNQAATTYTAEMFLRGGNHEITLEYFEGGGNALARVSWEALTGECFANVPSDHWMGEYYNNTELEGPLAMVRDEGAGFLNFDIGIGSPSEACGMGVDNFSVQWSRTINLQSGHYRFTVTADDGVRLMVNGQVLVDKWINQAATTYTANIFLGTGIHDIRLEYFEGGGNALARVSWEALPDECIASVQSNHWKGEYYNNTGLEGALSMVRDDGVGFLNFDVGVGSPSATCGIGVDNFSARWTRWVDFTPGRYRFTVTGDDGVRLYVSGQLVIDKWFNQAANTYTADVFLTTGGHEIKLEYFEAGGLSLARLNWAPIPSP
jgi:subtilisin